MAPASHSHHQPYEYLDVLLTAIPNDSIPPEIVASSSQGAAAHRPYSKFVDTALRLASGGPARPDDAPHIRDAWTEIQTSVQRALHALHPGSSSSPSQQATKRKHSPSLPDSTNNTKKPKYDEDADADDVDDVPQLTLHAISATAPVRHKVDIALHARTLRLAHATTGAPIARCARTFLTRVFLLPTRARSSGALQWTALLLAGDKPAPPSPRGTTGGKGAKATATTAVRFELSCSVPDSSSRATIPRITVHKPTSTSTSASTSQATSAREALLAVLSSTISGTPVTLTTVERGAPFMSVTAFRGVRETSLWFFDDGANAGILADGRPAEFWAVEDLARGEAGVRVRTATGRTCSVVLMRRGSGGDGAPGERDGEEGGEEEEEEEEGEETEFQMIDGKEREGILEWVRRHRGAFGVAEAREEDGAQAPHGAAKGNTEKANGKGAGAGMGTGKDREDSDSDSDFEASGDSDGGSPSSGGSASDSGSDAGSGSNEASSEGGSESGGGGEGDDDDEGMSELDPKHHPLLRAGALPRMSRAAMDAAVELVMDDLVGQGQVRRDASGPGPEEGLGRPAEDGDEGAVVGAGDDDEEDELED